MTAQSGVPHNNRVGDFDTFALLKLTKQGLSLDEVFKRLGKEGGMLGMSGISPDMRDIEQAAAERQARAPSSRSTRSSNPSAGSSANTSSSSAAATCSPSPAASARTASRSARPSAATSNGPASRWTRRRTRPAARKTRISRDDEPDAEIWIVPTNEELVVARQTMAVARGKMN